MRKIGIVALLVTAVMCLSQTVMGQEPAKFTLKGDIGYVLKQYSEGAVIESVALRVYPKMELISNGGTTLSFYGVFDGVPQVAELVVDLTVPGGSGSSRIPFVLEEGILTFDGKIAPHGGKMNDALRALVEELPKMKEAAALEAIRKFVAKEENAPASVILLSFSTSYGAQNILDIIAGAPQKVKGHRAIQALVPQLETEAMRSRNEKSTGSGAKFKDFSVFYGGKMQNLSDYVGKGKYVLVDFWASWCGPCMQEIPILVNIHKKYAGESFEVLGVAVNDKPQNTKNAIERMQISYPQIIGAGPEIAAIYGIKGIPHIILFAPDGTILYRGLRGEQIEEAVKKVLKK